jgi:D-alanyl-D-alanine carboxypeptidase (penicillin-binding protein 5/6)
VRHEPDIHASSAILVDAQTGQVLYARNPDAKRPPASTTKIITAILLLEHTKPQDIITASKKASEEEGSSLHLKPGEQISAHDLLYALMMRSANDGCVATAEHVAGTEDKFAQMMTEKAHEIGAVNSEFHNSNGLNQHPNLTTARDLSIMARYALSHFPEFDKVVSTKFHKITRSMDKKDEELRNHARFLWNYPGADGVKTGFTDPAGHCFVGAATRNGWRLISVVMNSPHWMHETISLMDYGFKYFQPTPLGEAGKVIADVPVHGGVDSRVDAVLAEPLHCVVPKGASPSIELKPEWKPVDAPVQRGADIGKVAVLLDGKPVFSAPLVAYADDNRSVISSVGHLSIFWYFFGAMLGIFAYRYGTTFTKNSRRSGSSFAPRLRNNHRRRAGHREWANRYGIGDESESGDR